MKYKNYRLAALMTVLSVSACKSVETEQYESYTVSETTKQEFKAKVLKDTEVTTLYMPFQSCYLEKGTIIEYPENPKMSGASILGKIVSVDTSKIEKSDETSSSQQVKYCSSSDAFLTTSMVNIRRDDLSFQVEEIKPEPVAAAVAETQQVNTSRSNFPILRRPEVDWNTHPVAKFGAGRNGRLHAAADLYTNLGSPIVAIMDGVVLDSYPFYSGTHAVEVKHINGKVVRYGEVAPGRYPATGSKVTAGQQIAKIGRMHCCRPMLHFEMFSGKASGLLSQPGRGSYGRRSDLINPSPWLNDHKNIFARQP